jgi:hypothetical protein
VWLHQRGDLWVAKDGTDAECNGRRPGVYW